MNRIIFAFACFIMLFNVYQIIFKYDLVKARTLNSRKAQINVWIRRKWGETAERIILVIFFVLWIVVAGKYLL